MKIIIFGGSGQVGFEIAQKMSTYAEVISTFNKNEIIAKNCTPYKIDISDHDETQKLISSQRPDIIINATAFPNVDKCETEPDTTCKINVQGTINIVKSCINSNTKLVFISSAFVFGNNIKTCKETDLPNPINMYGKQKLQSENTIIESGFPFLIIRTDQIYGWSKPGQRQSFVKNVLEKLTKKQRIDVCIDWYNNPTLVSDIAECVKKLLMKHSLGVYHVVGSEYLNRYDWAVKIAKRFNLDEKFVNPINSSDLNLPAKRPNCNLSNSKVTEEIKFHMKNVDEGLDYMWQFSAVQNE